MVAARYGSLPFREQIDFFRSKVAIPTERWDQIYADEHDHVFMVAGANRMAIVEDFQAAIGKMIDSGSTIEDFRRDFDDIVERHGWPYKGGRGWRTRVIYDTNLRQSYHAGREAQMADPETRRARPYGLYRHGGSRDPRPEHLALDGTVLPLDDPWWDVYSPQNGWGCSCKKFTLSERDVERLGLKVLDRAPPVQYEERVVGATGPEPRTVRVPQGVDPGFEYRPGASRVRGTTPPQRPAPLQPGQGLSYPDRRPSDTLPSARAQSTSAMREGLRDEEYVRSFLREFGADIGSPVVHRDPLGEPLLISEALFLTQRGTWRVERDGRERFMPILARTVVDPDEIYVAAEWPEGAEKPSVRRRYFAHFQVEGDEQPGASVFEWGRDGWTALTSRQSSATDIEQLRRGVRLYRREEGG